MKKLLLAALATVATFAPAAQARYQVDGYTVLEAQDFNQVAVRNLVTNLENKGIPVFDGADQQICAPRDNGGILMGVYNTKYNAIVLCTNNGDQAEIESTLAHEAVHMVQDCRDGLLNNTIRVNNVSHLVPYLSKIDAQEIKAFYPVDQYDAEIEARVFETNPAAVGAMVNRECRGDRMYR